MSFTQIISRLIISIITSICLIPPLSLDLDHSRELHYHISDCLQGVSMWEPVHPHEPTRSSQCPATDSFSSHHLKWEGVCFDFHAVHFKVREMCSSFQACLHFREIFCQTLSLYTLIPNFRLPCLCYFVTMILTMLFSLPLFQIPSNL